MSLKGTNLLSELRENSGLDQDFFDTEMTELMRTYSLNPDTLDLDQLRAVLSDYLQTLILEESQSAHESA